MRAFLRGCWAGTAPFLIGFPVMVVLALVAHHLVPAPYFPAAGKVVTASLLVLYFVLVYERSFDFAREAPRAYKAFAGGVVAINVFSIVPVVMIGFPSHLDAIQVVEEVLIWPALFGTLWLGWRNGVATGLGVVGGLPSGRSPEG